MNSRILRLGLQLAAAVAFMASLEGCSNWVLGVVQSFGASSDAKISTIAGNGTGGYTGDGGPATSAELRQPYHVAVDSAGSMYIADTNNQIIRKVNTNGTITLVAGVPSLAGHANDNGPATSAQLSSPVGVAVDGSGNIYISDSANYAIREVSGPNITTIAGTLGVQGHSSAQLGYPYGITADASGNLWFADMDNSVIWKVNSTHSGISIVAGTLNSAGYSGDGHAAISAQLNYPYDVAVDASGNIYIADSSNYVVRKVDTSGSIATVAGNGINGYTGDGGPATKAEIGQPYGVTVDTVGNLYISDSNNVVRKVDTSNNISTVAGNVHLGAGYGGDGNVATAAILDAPWGLAIDLSGNLLIADRINNRIRKVAFGK